MLRLKIGFFRVVVEEVSGGGETVEIESGGRASSFWMVWDLSRMKEADRYHI